IRQRIDLLVVVSVMVDFVVVAASNFYLSVDWYRELWLALSISQISIIAFWCGLGKESAPAFAVLMLVIGAWCAMASNGMEVLEILARITVAELVVLAVARTVGIRLRFVDSNSFFDPPPIQFSLRQMFVGTTLVAAAIVVGKFTQEYGGANLGIIVF